MELTLFYIDIQDEADRMENARLENRFYGSPPHEHNSTDAHRNSFPCEYSKCEATQGSSQSPSESEENTGPTLSSSPPTVELTDNLAQAYPVDAHRLFLRTDPKPTLMITPEEQFTTPLSSPFVMTMNTPALPFSSQTRHRSSTVSITKLSRRPSVRYRQSQHQQQLGIGKYCRRPSVRYKLHRQSSYGYQLSKHCRRPSVRYKVLRHSPHYHQQGIGKYCWRPSVRYKVQIFWLNSYE